MVTKIDLLLIAGAGLALFLIIRGAGQALSGLKFPDLASSIGDIKFPDFDFKFPEIKLPSLDFLGDLLKQDDTSILAGETVPLQEGSDILIKIPEDTMVDKETGIVTSSTPPIVVSGGGATFQEQLFAQLRGGVFDTLFENLGLDPKFAQTIVSEAKTVSDLSDILKKANEGFFTQTQEVQPFTQGGPDKESEISDIVSNLPFGFEGGGPSFIGGSIFQTPIQNLTLSQIIDKFNVTASQAANIKAIAGDDFPSDFVFGTNTGGGIGSVFETVKEFEGLGGNVSNPVFAGLTLEEIANKITGGNISNF